MGQLGQFDGIKDVDVSKGGQYFKPGSFRVKITGVKMVDSASSPGKSFFVVETLVLKSSNPEILEGAERSQVITMGQTMSLPNVKAFMAAASCVDPASETINDEVEAYWQKKLNENVPFGRLCELVVSEANPLGGLEMDLECVQITTKGEKKPFTKHLWQPRVEG
jgi:hypothetical protein